MLQVDTDVPVPDVGDDQVLVRVIFAGVNPVETYIREGKSSSIQQSFSMYTPLISQVNTPDCQSCPTPLGQMLLAMSSSWEEMSPP